MSTEPRKTATAASWKKAAVHHVTCPSGVEIDVKIPDLPEMILSGVIPQNLLDVAIGVADAGEDIKPSIDLVKEQREFTNLLVLATVVEPKLTDADLGKDGVPTEDKAFIVDIATRTRDLDAVGEHIAGLTKSEKFRRFRELGEFKSNVEGL